MKILITGSSGMLGRAISQELANRGSYELWGVDLRDAGKAPGALGGFIFCDITDPEKVDGAIKKIMPDVVIHTAAYTDVDGCEADKDKAQAVNALGTKYVAQAASDAGAGLIYISTDFVFDGEKRSPYTEDDAPNPLSVYGRSKLDGEKFVASIMKDKPYFIVRTSWLFGMDGINFVDMILKKAEAAGKLRVVSDQFGSPTYAADLAKAIANILGVYGQRGDIYGIYHVTNSDDCSWFRFAEKALELARIYDVALVPITSRELSRAAERPAMSVLDNGRYIRIFKEPLRPWDAALAEYIMLRRTGHV